MRFRRLLPSPGEVDELELLATLRERQPPPGRPYVAVNFVASVDGRATVGGHSGPLGDDGDRAMFHGLREQFDAVLAGTGTLRTERYGRLIARPERRERRLAAGLPAEPLACIISRSGAVPDDLPLLGEPEARVALFTAAPGRAGTWRAQVEVVPLPAGELLLHALGILRERFGIRSLLCEGGPTLFSALLHDGLVDELFLTVAPALVGGDPGPGVTTGPPLADPALLELRWLLERAGSLYLRYAVTR